MNPQASMIVAAVKISGQVHHKKSAESGAMIAATGSAAILSAASQR